MPKKMICVCIQSLEYSHRYLHTHTQIYDCLCVCGFGAQTNQAPSQFIKNKAIKDELKLEKYQRHSACDRL